MESCTKLDMFIFIKKSQDRQVCYLNDFLSAGAGVRHGGGGREKEGREGEEEWGLNREEFGQKVLQTTAKFNFHPPQVTKATAVALEQSSCEGARGHSPATVRKTCSWSFYTKWYQIIVLFRYYKLLSFSGNSLKAKST